MKTPFDLLSEEEESSVPLNGWKKIGKWYYGRCDCCDRVAAAAEHAPQEPPICYGKGIPI